MKKLLSPKKAMSLISSLFILLLCSNSPQSSVESNADGKLDNGVRVIAIAPNSKTKTVRVYRGDAVELLFEKKSVPVVSIPNLKREVTLADKGSQLSVTFTAADTGSFPMVSADNTTVVTLSVTEFKAHKSVTVKILTGKEAEEVLKDTSIFIIDVRTPGEFASGHIPRANLYPVNELATSVDKIIEYKDQPVFVYCRSGNRSAVAIQILTQKGFSNILHLRRGIISWTGDVVK